DKRRVAGVVGVVLHHAEEVSDAIVGQARVVAALGQLAQAVVDDDGDAAAVDDRVAAAAAGVGGGDLQLDVLRERLDLVPGAAAGVEGAAAQLGEVGHEDVIEADEDTLAGGVDRVDLQRHQHTVVVGGLDRLRDGRAGLGLEVDVAADEEDAVADALEEDDPLLAEVERVAALGHAA